MRSKDAIGWLPGGLAHLALQDADLLLQRRHLGAQLDVGAGADEDDVDEEADELVDEGERILADRPRHRLIDTQAALSDLLRLAGPRGPEIELTLRG